MSEIATAGAADLRDVVALLGAQFAEHDIDVSDLERAALGLLEHPSRGAILLASIGGARVGIAVLAFTWTLEHGGHVAWLDELYVVPAQREHGVGRALLAHAITHARASGCVAIDLEVDAEHARVESLYERHGFERLHRSRWALRL